MKRPLAAVLSAAVVLSAAPVRADDAQKTQLTELERKVDALTQEIENMKLGEAAAPPPLKAQDGLGPAASKVYEARPDKLSIGGYGEFVFLAPSSRAQNGDPSGLQRRADLQRGVFYFGYKFNDWLLYNSEVEFEHASSGTGDETRGEVELEQSYVEARPWKEFGGRVGHLIVPLGLVNEVHEPTAFNGVNRPSVETFIIPSTWHENGIGVFGDVGPVSYRTYAMASLSAVASADPSAGGFAADSGIREGSTEGTNSPAGDLAWASRVDVAPFEGTTVSAGLYLDRADHGSAPSSFPVTLWETHAQTQWRGASVKALYTEGRIGNVDQLNAAQGYVGSQSVGSRMFGGYAEAAFDALTLLRDPKGQSLSPFFRYERYDTQLKVPAGYSKDPANSRVEYTLGLTYKPVEKLAIKLDQQWKLNEARTGVNQWNFGVGYIF
jgi:hypothetical protein